MKIICIGRNYAEHVAELGNNVPDKPLIFMKPSSALLINDKPFYLPDFSEDIHYEAELVLKIGKNGKQIQPEFATSYISEITVGIDFTARDLQSELKEKGQPWELAKGFDGSAVVGRWQKVENWEEILPIYFSLTLDGDQVQSGNTEEMIFSAGEIICYTSKFFKLNVGDMIFTGTPSGVGQVRPGNRLEGYLRREKLLHCDVK